MLICRATQKVADAHATMNTYLNASDKGTVILGNATTQLLANLGDSYGRVLQLGDEIVVQQACHEANIGPWVKAAGKQLPCICHRAVDVVLHGSYAQCLNLYAQWFGQGS